MAFGTGATSSRGGSPGFRFTLYAAAAIVIMFLDQRGEYLERIRYGLSLAVYPLELAVSSPSQAWNWIHESIETREALREQNAQLLTRNRELELRSMRYEALARENEQLRGLREALPPVAERWLVAEIMDIQLNSLRQRVLIDRGSANGVFKGQAVMDDQGLLGQTTHVGPWSAEVILITDPEHAVPVQIERTGLKTIAVGTGDTGSLALPYLPANADVKAGDVLLTSGLGGVFPAGYPVGRVAEVHRDAVQPLAQVRATPFARMDVDREVMLVWFREGHPAAPVAALGDATKGTPKMQPQPAPSKPPISGTTAPAPAPPRTGAPGPGESATPGNAAAAPGSAKARPPKPTAPESPETGDEESPPIQEDVPAKPEPKASAAERAALPDRAGSPDRAASPERAGPSEPTAPPADSPAAPPRNP